MGQQVTCTRTQGGAPFAPCVQGVGTGPRVLKYCLGPTSSNLAFLEPASDLSDEEGPHPAQLDLF